MCHVYVVLYCRFHSFLQFLSFLPPSFAVFEEVLLSQPDIPKSMIYDIMIESHLKLWFTIGCNMVASSLITELPDYATP
jgi:hypothetical protein